MKDRRDRVTLELTLQLFPQHKIECGLLSLIQLGVSQHVEACRNFETFTLLSNLAEMN